MKNNIDYNIESDNNIQNLSDVFSKINRIGKNVFKSHKEATSSEDGFWQAEQKNKVKLRKIIFADVLVMAIISFCVFANYIFAFSQDDSYSEDAKAVAVVKFEANMQAIELENILLENVKILKTKELIDETVDAEFETQYVDDENLPLGEEKVEQEGVLGSKAVTVIKTYENAELVEENVLEEKVLVEPKAKIIKKGTSEFLKNNGIALGATIYALEDVKLKEKKELTSQDVDTIPSSMDVILKEMTGEWCRVQYKGKEGYVTYNKFTSAIATPTIVNSNRVKKLKLSANENMALNRSSGLTLDDFKKVLSNKSLDKNAIFQNAAEDFYKADVNYNINGILLASIGIHESAWGTSKISLDKKNLFGYGAYDASPYESALTFATYYEGIEVLAKSLSKNYLNPSGTVLKNGEIASGIFYNGNTVSAINIRYASDPEWHNKVWKYMSDLYNSL